MQLKLFLQISISSERESKNPHKYYTLSRSQNPSFFCTVEFRQSCKLILWIDIISRKEHFKIKSEFIACKTVLFMA